MQGERSRAAPTGGGRGNTARPPEASARLPSPLPASPCNHANEGFNPSNEVPHSNGGRSLDRVSGAASLRLPGLPAGVPADEDERGDERRDGLELLLGQRAVDPQFPDVRALIRDLGSSASRFVLIACSRAEPERALLRERDPGPGHVRPSRETGNDLAEDVVGVSSSLQDLADLDRRLLHVARSSPSNARIAARTSSGTGTGVLPSTSTRTRVCWAVTMSVSSGSR